MLPIFRSAHRSIRIAALCGGIVTAAVFAPIVTAVLMLRCCGSVSGPTLGAWLVLGAVLVLLALVGAVVAGVLMAGVRALWQRRRSNSPAG